MAKLDNRLQILIDEPRLRRVREAAERDGVPVGEWIRDLIDQKIGAETQGQRIRDFIAYVKTIEPVDFGGDALEELHAARDERADYLMNVGREGDRDGRSA